jgi:hypothetical protein
MKLKISPSLAVSGVALFAALGGTGYAASNFVANANNARHLGGKDANYYLAARHFVSSGGEHFFGAGRTVTLGQAGHFTFTATCSNDNTGQNQVTFDVVANTTAGLDGNPPQAAGNKVNIHTNSDALDTTADHTLNPGDFDQVGSASSSTEIAVDGQEADIFYNDGVNWPAGNGSRAHDCFAGYTGFLAGRS